ncbi:MAG TPA: universal stress protein [Polyangiales bacterium]
MTDMNSHHPYTIVVAIDFSAPCEAAVKEALRLAAEHSGSELHAVHIIDPRTGGTRSVRMRTQDVALGELPARMRAYVAAQADGFENVSDLALGVHIRLGQPVAGILQLTIDIQADLLVVGTHGHNGVLRVALGSIAEELVRTAHCPVLTARPIAYEGLRASDRAEPACTDCLETRKQTAGAHWWCDHHRTALREVHTYSAVEPVRWVHGSADVYGAGTSASQT